MILLRTVQLRTVQCSSTITVRTGWQFWGIVRTVLTVQKCIVLKNSELKSIYCTRKYCLYELYCILYRGKQRRIVPHCIVVYCDALYCSLLYFIVFYCTVLYCMVVYFIILYCAVVCCFVLKNFFTIFCWIMLFCAVFCIR